MEGLLGTELWAVHLLSSHQRAIVLTCFSYDLQYVRESVCFVWGHFFCDNLFREKEQLTQTVLKCLLCGLLCENHITRYIVQFQRPS